jgi:hypothetical protein
LEKIPRLKINKKIKLIQHILYLKINQIRKTKKKLIKNKTSSSLNLPALQIRSNSSPPAAYSMMIAR